MSDSDSDYVPESESNKWRRRSKRKQKKVKRFEAVLEKPAKKKPDRLIHYYVKDVKNKPDAIPLKFPKHYNETMDQYHTLLSMKYVFYKGRIYDTERNHSISVNNRGEVKLNISRQVTQLKFSWLKMFVEYPERIPGDFINARMSYEIIIGIRERKFQKLKRRYILQDE